MIDLAEFIQKGRYNGLKPGDGFAIVEEQIGEIANEERWYFEANDPKAGFSVLRSGIEWQFMDGELYGIQIDVVDGMFCLNKGYQLGNHTPISVLLAYLDWAGIDWSFYSKDTFGKQLAIQMASGVKCTYEYNEYNELVLTSFYLFKRIK